MGDGGLYLTERAILGSEEIKLISKQSKLVGETYKRHIICEKK